MKEHHRNRNRWTGWTTFNGVSCDICCNSNVLIDCQCGCGEIILARGKANQSVRYKLGHGMKFIRGENSHAWRGGRIVDHEGYIRVKCDGHPKATKIGSYVREHILVMEKVLGRYLGDDELVHHINENRQDNRPENLMLMTRGAHGTHHNFINWRRGIYNNR